MDFEKTKRVIADSKVALELFDKQPVAENFRLAVILNVTLIRAIGHILQNEISCDAKLVSINKELFTAKKDDEIFAHFIKEFRDKVLKEYISAVNWASITVQATKAHRMEYLITEGEFEGKDFIALVSRSIEWWEGYLTELIKLTSQ